MALPLSISKNDKILILAPHPDDECIGPGGLLAKYPDLCDVIIMTDGRYGGVHTRPEEEWKIRKRQFESEMKYLGISSYRWIGFEDGMLFNYKGCMKDIDFSSYTKIFLPWGEDNHIDHTATFMYAVERIKEQQLKETEVFQYEVHVPFHDVTEYLDITSYIDEKIKLIRFHEEQVNAYDYDMIAKSLGKYRACQMNCPDRYYETYVRTDVLHNNLADAYLHREAMLQKYKQFYRTFYNWIDAYLDGKTVCDYLKEKQIGRIAIYGYGGAGQILYKELAGSDIEICCILDKRSIESKSNAVKVCHPEDGDRSADAVLVTVMLDYDSIKIDLERMGYHNIYLLSAIIDELSV